MRKSLPTLVLSEKDYDASSSVIYNLYAHVGTRIAHAMALSEQAIRR